MKRVRLSVIFLLLLGIATAQENEVENRDKEFGGHIGATTGIGLSYRQWFDKFGVQATAIPVKTDDFFFASAGLTGLYSLKKTKYIRAYLYLGNHLLFTNEKYEDYDYNGNYIGTVEDFNRQYNIGFGPGFSFGRVVAFNLMFGYGIYDLTDRFNMFPTGEIGVYYMF